MKPLVVVETLLVLVETVLVDLTVVTGNTVVTEEDGVVPSGSSGTSGGLVVVVVAKLSENTEKIHVKLISCFVLTHLQGWRCFLPTGVVCMLSGSVSTFSLPLGS